MRRSPRRIVRQPSDDELRTRLGCVQEVDDCVWEAFIVRIRAGGDVILLMFVFYEDWLTVK